MNICITRRQLLAAGTASACSAFALRGGVVRAAQAQAAEIQDAVRLAVAAAVDSGDIPGVVAQVWRRGELCADASAGWRDVERRSPMQRDAVFGIASMSKPITVALALRLVDAGKLRLDDPVARWIPEFARMRVLRRLDGPLEDTVPAMRLITVEDLMTHRSGLTYGFLTPPPLGNALLARVGMGIESEMTPDDWLKALAELPLACQPGERFVYGHSIDVLGFLAARVLGTDLAAAMREMLFAPLGMADTGFWIPPEKRARMVPFYVSTRPGEFTRSTVGVFSSPKPMAFASGGQGLVSTASDYLRFARMLMHDGQLDGVRVLKGQTARLMRSNHFTEAQRKLPFVGGMPFTQGFGLGVSVVIDDTLPGVVTGNTGTFGWPGAFGGWWQADPREDLVLLWLQQCTPAPPQPGQAMPRIPGAQATQQFRATVYQALR